MVTPDAMMPTFPLVTSFSFMHFENPPMYFDYNQKPLYNIGTEEYDPKHFLDYKCTGIKVQNSDARYWQ